MRLEEVGSGLWGRVLIRILPSFARPPGRGRPGLRGPVPVHAGVAGSQIPAEQKSLLLAQEAFSGGGRPGVAPVVPKNYLAGAWSGVLEVEASCSRSFFSRLISTRPPLVRLVFGCSSVLAFGTG